MFGKRKIEKLEHDNERLGEVCREKDEAYTKLWNDRRELAQKYQNLERDLEEKFKEKKAIAYKTMELEFKQKHMEEIGQIKDEYAKKLQQATEENYAKLKDSLAKIHEEGNATTKYVEKLSLKLMDAAKPGVPTLENKNDVY